MSRTAVRTFLFVVLAGVIASCASRRPAPIRAAGPKPIRSIAVVPGDPLANAIGIELFNQGFRTFEIPAIQELTPAALQSLAGRGVDAVLVVTSTKGRDMLPESATLRLSRTPTGETVATFKWSNSDPRKNAAETARELVRTLLETVPKPS